MKSSKSKHSFNGVKVSTGQFQMKQSKSRHRAGQPKINTIDRAQLCHFICSRMLSVFPGYSMLKK